MLEPYYLSLEVIYLKGELCLMSKDNSAKISELKDRLERLTKVMDVPCFRYSSIKWLSKNLEARNANHPNFREAKLLVDELSKLGAV